MDQVSDEPRPCESTTLFLLICLDKFIDKLVPTVNNVGLDLYLVPYIGLGRFRILGGPRFRILGGGGQIPSRHMSS